MREVSCICHTELEIATLLLSGVQMISSVNVAALLRKSTATEFLRKVKEKRAAECFPEDCSSEVDELEEVEEVNTSSQLIVLCFPVVHNVKSSSVVCFSNDIHRISNKKELTDRFYYYFADIFCKMEIASRNVHSRFEEHSVWQEKALLAT